MKHSFSVPLIWKISEQAIATIGPVNASLRKIQQINKSGTAIELAKDTTKALLRWGCFPPLELATRRAVSSRLSRHPSVECCSRRSGLDVSKQWAACMSRDSVVLLRPAYPRAEWDRWMGSRSCLCSSQADPADHFVGAGHSLQWLGHFLMTGA